MTFAPPPLPPVRRANVPFWQRIVLFLAFTAGGMLTVCVVCLITLRIFGLVIPYSIPSSSMTPAINAGDSIVMEGITYRKNSPRRGDLVVFKTDKIPGIPGNEIWVKRLVGLPGDQLQIKSGILYVNREPVALRNCEGTIRYSNFAESSHLRDPFDTETVPGGSYFVLGDNTAHSSDSRHWGLVPAREVIGRAVYRYLPLDRVGVLE